MLPREAAHKVLEQSNDPAHGAMNKHATHGARFYPRREITALWKQGDLTALGKLFPQNVSRCHVIFHMKRWNRYRYSHARRLVLDEAHVLLWSVQNMLSVQTSDLVLTELACLLYHSCSSFIVTSLPPCGFASGRCPMGWQHLAYGSAFL